MRVFFALVALLTVWSSTTISFGADRSVSILKDTDLPGNDYKIIKGATLDQCQQACGSDNQCHAFTFNSKAKWCFLKSIAGAPVSFTGAISGAFTDGGGDAKLVSSPNSSALSSETLRAKALNLLAKALYCQAPPTQRGSPGYSDSSDSLYWVRSWSDANELTLKIGGRTFSDTILRADNVNGGSNLGAISDYAITVSASFANLADVTTKDGNLEIDCKNNVGCIDNRMETERHCWVFLDGYSPCVAFALGVRTPESANIPYKPVLPQMAASVNVQGICAAELPYASFAVQTLIYLAAR